MHKSRADFSVLTRKAAIDASSVALGVRMASRFSTGRTTAFSHATKDVPFVHTERIEYEFRKPNDRVHYARLEELTKSANDKAIRAKSFSLSVGPDIILWPEQDGLFDFKKLAAIGRRTRTAAQGYDPDAEDADGDMMVQDGTPWERPKTPKVSKRGQRKPGKTRVAVASGLENVADRVDAAAAKRRSRRQERGPLKERIAGRIEGTADRIDKRRAGKPSKPSDGSAEKPKRSRAGLAERFGDYLYGDQREKPSKYKPSTKPDVTPEVAPDNEPDLKPEGFAPSDPSTAKPKTPVEDITATVTATEKLPGKVIGKPDEDKNFAVRAAKDASAKKENAYGEVVREASTIHVVKNDEGKFVVVDDERLSAMEGAKPVATFKAGELTHVDGEKYKKNGKTVTSDQIEAAAGWGRGEPYESNAVDRLSTLENTYFYQYGGKQFEAGENAHIVKTSDGKYYIVDEEKLQALGIEPIRSEKVGEGEFIYATEPKPKVTPRKPQEEPAVGQIPGEGPMEKPSLSEVAADAKKKPKKPKLDGKQDGKYQKEITAYVRANKLSYEDGKDRYVVDAPGGGYAIVDKDRLDAMGVEPLSTHSKGKGKMPDATSKKPKASEADAPEADVPEAKKPKKPSVTTLQPPEPGTEKGPVPEWLKPKPEGAEPAKPDEPDAWAEALEDWKKKPKESAKKPKTDVPSEISGKQLNDLLALVGAAQKNRDADSVNAADTAIEKMMDIRLQELKKAGVDPDDFSADTRFQVLSKREDEIASLREAIVSSGGYATSKPEAKKPKESTKLRRGFTVNEQVIGPSEDLENADLYGADLTYADLSDANLSDADLTGADLRKADLTGANLIEAHLEGANLSDADLTDANLSEADLTGANLTGAILIQANLEDTILAGANLTGANLSGVSLYRTNLTGANLSGVDLTGVNLNGVDLKNQNLAGANLAGASLYQTNLTGANLSGVDLTDANLYGATLTGATLTDGRLAGANLTNVNLTGINLTDADLRGANLFYTNLSGADLSGADLTDANLTDADLRGADLTGADLTGADLTGAKMPKGWEKIVKAKKPKEDDAKPEVPETPEAKKPNEPKKITPGSKPKKPAKITPGMNLSGLDLTEYILNGGDVNLKDRDLSNTNLSGMDLSNADMSGANLDGAYLSGANLEGTNLSDAILSGVNLTGANLRGANLSGANLTGADLTGADLTGADLSDADLTGVVLTGANLQGAGLTGANLYGVDLKNQNLSGTDMNGAKLQASNLEGADLSGANLEGADLRNVNLKNQNLTGANLQDADLEDADLSGADLSGANLSYVSLTKARLSGANLEGADLTHAFMKDATMRNANLSNANLTNAIIYGTNFEDANLSDADLTGAGGSANLRNANLSNANLTGAKLNGADLTGAKLDGVDLTDAKLVDANLSNADLREANLTNADLRGADLTNADLTDVDLTGADLTGADLAGAKMDPGSAYFDETKLKPGSLPDGEKWKSVGKGNYVQRISDIEEIPKGSFDTPEDLISAYDLAIEETNQAISERFQELSDAGLDNYEIGKDPVTNALVELADRLKADKKMDQGAYATPDNTAPEPSTLQSEAAKLIDDSGDLVDGVSQGKAKNVIDSLTAENDHANDEAIVNLTVALAKSEAEQPTSITSSSPLPYKTSAKLDIEAMDADGFDVEGMTETIDNVLQKQTDLSRTYLSEYLGIEEPLNDEEMRKALVNEIEKLSDSPPDGVSPWGEVDADTLKSNSARRSSLRVQLHNWDVITRQGAYSEDNSPELTGVDRLNHLSPAGQKSFLKALEQLSLDSLEGEEPTEDDLSDIKEIVDTVSGFLVPQGKKSKKPKEVAKEIVDDFVADVKKNIAGPESKPKLLKVDGQSMDIATIGQVAILSPDDARGKGVSTLGADDESKFPPGSILGYLQLPAGSTLGEAQALAYKDGKKRNYLPKGMKKGDVELAQITAADGSVVAVVLDPKADGFAEWDLDKAFPYANSSDREGAMSNWINLGSPHTDASPDKDSPLYDLNTTSVDGAEINDATLAGIQKGIPILGGSPPKTLEMNLAAAFGSSGYESLNEILLKKFGEDGGVVVRSPDGNYHAIPTKEWQDALDGMSADEKLSHDLIVKSEPQYVSWAKTFNSGKKISDVPWDSISAEVADETLKELFEITNFSDLAKMGLTTANDHPHPKMGTESNLEHALTTFGYFGSTAEKDPDHVLNTTGGGEWGLFSVRVKQSGYDQGATQQAVLLGGDDLSFALAHPGFFGKPLWRYSSLASPGESVGDIADTGTASEVLRMIENPADISFIANGNITGSKLQETVAKWEPKLTTPANLNMIEKKIEGSKQRLADMGEVLKKAIGDRDPKTMTVAELKEALSEAGVDADTFIGKVMEVAVKLDVSNRFMASQMMVTQDALETEQELKEMLDKNPKDIGRVLQASADLKNEITNATKDLSEATLALENATTGPDVREQYDKVNNAKIRLKTAEALAKVHADITESHKKKFTTVFSGGEQYDLKKSSVIAEGAGSIESAANIAAAIAPILPSGTSIGIFKEDLGGYTLVKMEDAIEAGLPAPSAIFSSSGVGGIPVVDSTELMNLTTAPGMPKVPDNYQGTTALGVNSVDGKAIGQHIPTPMSTDPSPIDENHLLVKEWSQKIADGASLADVPNELLKESIWANTEGGGGGSGRFKLLSKATGFNDHGKGPKDQTQRFLDTATGQTFVIKSATRNDQEGIRELFGNQVMQMLGFPSSGGRTAGVVDKSPNKFPDFHPEYDAEADQVPILIESSEMLYEGKSLGHIRNMPSSQQQDIISRLTPESVATGVVMDSLFRYYDRQGDNWIAIENLDGSVAYHPIDHGNAFGPFKGQKFFDKDGKKLGKGQSSPADEDALGFMFSGLDGEGAWKIARESMNTSERRQMFAEAAIHAVRRAESIDYAGEAEKLIQGQNLDGKSAGRARTSAQALEEKKDRLDSYIDPMLKELGMTDDEIAAARSKVDGEFGKGAMKASQSPKVLAPNATSSKISSPEVTDGEEAFGNSPVGKNANTVTVALGQAALNPGSIQYTTVGMGRQTKDGVRFTSFKPKNEGEPPVVSMSTRLDSETARLLGEALLKGTDAQGNPVTILQSGSNHVGYQSSGGKWTLDTTGIPQLATLGWQGQHVMAKLSDGSIVVVNFASDKGDNFSTRGLTSVFYPEGKPTPDKVASTLSSIGVSDIGYVDDDGWKMRAAELLTRTFDKELLNNGDSMAVRLARVASERGITVNDLEPYHDSMGRLRFRLNDNGYKELLARHPELAKTTHVAKSMESYGDGSNIVRVITAGGQASKIEQIMSGGGMQTGALGGAGGVGASPTSDLGSGGGDGLFMSAFAGDSTMGSSGGQHQLATFWGSGKETWVVMDAEQQIRDIGWWAHGSSDGPYGALNPTSGYGQTAINNGSVDPIAIMELGKVFEFMGNGTTPLEHISFVILPPAARTKAIKTLKDQGITQINGKPVEDFIISSKAGSKLRAALGPKWTKSKFGSLSTPKKASAGEIAYEENEA